MTTEQTMGPRPWWTSAAAGTTRPRLARRVLAAAAALLATTLPTQAARAQRLPFVMQHGIRADSTTWQLTGEVLRGLYPVEPRRRSVDWTQRYDPQWTQLRARLGVLPDTTAAVAHSSGGLVMRHGARAGFRMKGLVTVGTPNGGAPAAGNVQRGVTNRWIASAALDAQMLVTGLAGVEADRWEVALSTLLGGAVFSAQVAHVTVNVLDFRPGYPLWDEMRASSPYIQTVTNGATGLTSERNAIRVRAFIPTQVDRSRGIVPMHLAVPDDPTLGTGALAWGVAAGLVLATHYSDYCAGTRAWDVYAIPKCRAAYAAFSLAFRGVLLEPTWCTLIQHELSAAADPWLIWSACAPSDAVVPVARQALASGEEIGGATASHVRQTRSELVRSGIERFLERSLQTARCGSGPIARTALRLDSTVFAVGDTVRARADGWDACDAPTSAPLAGGAWRTSDATIASVTLPGTNSTRVTALRPGMATLTLTSPVGTQTRSVEVLAPAALRGTLRVHGCPGNICRSPQLELAGLQTGTRPATVAWLVNDLPTGATGQHFWPSISSTTKVTAVIRNPAGTEHRFSIVVSPPATGDPEQPNGSTPSASRATTRARP